jgi:quinol monooxygenase YgiN
MGHFTISIGAKPGSDQYEALCNEPENSERRGQRRRSIGSGAVGGKGGQADKVAEILDRFLPEAQSEPGAKLFLIARGRENPAQFLFYELFRDEAAFKAHQESAHFKTYIAGQALPLLARRERAQYALL